MPRGRKPTGDRALTGAERQARYRPPMPAGLISDLFVGRAHGESAVARPSALAAPAMA